MDSLQQAQLFAARGKVVQLTVSYWRAHSPRSLGLPQAFSKDEWRKLLVLPSFCVSKLRKIEKDFHSNLAFYSYDLGIIGHFMTDQSRFEWGKKHQEILKRFEEQRDWVAGNYDNLRGQAMQVGRQIAIEDWKQLYPGKGDPTESFITECGRRVIETIPSKKQIFDGFTVKTLWVSLGEENLATEAAALDFLGDIAGQFRERVEALCLGILKEAKARRRLRYNYLEGFFRRLNGIEAVFFFENQPVASVIDRMKKIGISEQDKDHAELICLSRELMVEVVPNFSEEQLAGLIGK